MRICAGIVREARHRMAMGARGKPHLAWLFLALVAFTAPAGGAEGELRIDGNAWRIIPRESGPTNYYRLVSDSALPYIHAAYRPPYETAVMGFQVSGHQARAFHHLTWSWRAIVLPRGGNECAHGVEDSAAVVYVTWKRGLRYHTIKYVWSAVGTKGAVCDRQRNLFSEQDTVILQTGGPLGVWKTEDIDLDAEYHAHFGGGDIPDFQGLGIMTDGDQTRSESAADYGEFVLSR
jgi:Protein of unknown function (DUF3047)